MTHPMDKHGNYIYNYVYIRELTASSTWRGCLSCPERSESDRYILLATGDCSLDGRKYVSLPVETNLSDSKVKEKYNLM